MNDIDDCSYLRSDLSETLAKVGAGPTPIESAALDGAAAELTDDHPRKRQRKNPKTDESEPEASDEEAAPIGEGRCISSVCRNWEPDASRCELWRCVQFHPLYDINAPDLWKVEPDYVIMYSPDVAFLRQVELYQAENPEKKLKMFILYYDESAEKMAFEALVRRESDVFSNLIQNKGRITIPLDVGTTDTSILDGPGIGSLGKRRFGLERCKRYKIVVDMREFNSKLPATLHKAGFDLIPVTLEVGDFILTPDIIIERKTLPDLFASLRSGRLYNQSAAMCRKYQIPILLIEFDGDKQFRLQSDADIGRDISPQCLTSKLCLLILHFPKIRIVWSPSTHATCRLFDAFKRNRSDPEIEEVVQQETGMHPLNEVINEKAVAILKKLPGVTDTNARKLMTVCPSLAALAKTTVARLTEIMDSEKNAKALHSFLHAPYPTTKKHRK